MADIEKELQAFKSAAHGEDVRDALISTITKMNKQLNAGTLEEAITSETIDEIVNSK